MQPEYQRERTLPICEGVHKIIMANSQTRAFGAIPPGFRRAEGGGARLPRRHDPPETAPEEKKGGGSCQRIGARRYSNRPDGLRIIPPIREEMEKPNFSIH